VIRHGKYRGWLPLLLCAMLVTLLVLPLLARKTPLERFRERMVIGSTREAVEDALGCPPGDYRTHDDLTLALGLDFDDDECWRFNSATILVRFNQQDRVVDIHTSSYRSPFRPWWERIFD